MSILSLHEEADNIVELLKNLENKVIDTNLKNDIRFTNNLFKIRKKIFMLNLKIHLLEMNNKNNDEVKKLKKKIDFILENFKLLNDFNKEILQRNKKKAIDTLTIINTIFLPLALITGFFGMNFKSMGSPSLKKGIFTIKNSQLFILLLFAIITLIVFTLFHFKILTS